jgi:hypothetical protein
VTEALRERVWPELAEGVRVYRSELGPRASLLGAAGLVLSRSYNFSI